MDDSVVKPQRRENLVRHPSPENLVTKPEAENLPAPFNSSATLVGAILASISPTMLPVPRAEQERRGRIRVRSIGHEIDQHDFARIRSVNSAAEPASVPPSKRQHLSA